jgi:DNA polymerase I-like protein with 3'-5' exonuclease and polymerase domains
MRANRWDWRTIPLDHPLYWGYGAADPSLTAMLAEVLWPATQPYREAYDLELACERVLLGMELRGFAVDLDYSRGKRELLQYQLDLMREDLGDLNPNAPDDVAAFLKNAGVQFKRFTPTGKPQMTQDVLEELAEDHPIVRQVLAARSHTKLLSSYFGKFVSMACEHDGTHVLHPNIKQVAAATGRMSVVDPALQTLPRGTLVRDAFIPRPGNKLLLADYDNEELRLIAHFSQDRGMLEAFADGQDLHMNTARAAFGPDATRAQRQLGKNGIFSHAYGAKTPRLAETLGVDQGTAQRVADGIDRAYPGIPALMRRAIATIEDRAEGGDIGYMTLPDSRRLRVPVSKAYAGLDYLIQGTGRIIMARALVDLDAAGLGDWLDLAVHDEVVLDVPDADMEDARHTAQTVMTRGDFTVPLTVSTKVVDRWGDAYREDA